LLTSHQAIKLVVECRQIELTGDDRPHQGLIAKGYLPLPVPQKELYGVRRAGSQGHQVPYGDTKPVYIKALDAWIG